jgi:hypothetical protein
VAAAGGFVESSAVGPRRGVTEAPDPPPLESDPLLLHRIQGTVFSEDPFVPTAEADGGTELLAVDAEGSGWVWAVGGGAASGAAVTERGVDGLIERPPLAAVALGTGPFRELELKGAEFGNQDRFEDVAAVPGSSTAWVAVVPYGDRGRTNAKAIVANIDANTGLAAREALPLSGSGRGSAARIAFTSATDGWMVTNAGWLFHYTDGTHPPVDTDPAFVGPITSRPNEAAEQFVPDTAPADDSQLFAPPPVAVEQTPEPPEPKPLKALITGMSKPKVTKKLVLVLSFKVARKARVQLLAKRHGRVVAKTKNKTFKAGRHTLRLQLSRKHWPTALAFKTKELTLDQSQLAPEGDDTAVSTPGGG